MKDRYESIVIEHGDGINKHLFYIWNVYTLPHYRQKLYRSLCNSGVRDSIEDCYDAINEHFQDETNATFKVTTIYS